MQKTNDYSIFRQIDGNRKIHHGHVSRLKDAIERKNLLEYFPILLNEDMEIIDGQHRLTAAAALGLPITYAIVPGLRLADVVAINTHSKGWTIMDFVDSHIELGKVQYQTLKDFTSRYGMGVTTSAALLMGYTSMKTGGISKVIKNGDFRIGSLEQAEYIAEQLIVLKKYCSDFNPTQERELIMALLLLRRNQTFDFDRLIAKLRLSNGSIAKRISVKYYLLQIEEVYNFNAKITTELYASSMKNK